MKMIIVLDKICLAAVIVTSVYIGYKAGVTAAAVKYATNQAMKTNFDSED